MNQSWVNLDLPIKSVRLRRRIGDAAYTRISKYPAAGNVTNGGDAWTSDGGWYERNRKRQGRSGRKAGKVDRDKSVLRRYVDAKRSSSRFRNLHSAPRYLDECGSV